MAHMHSTHKLPQLLFADFWRFYIYKMLSTID
jgi:hypothetical protein